MKIQSMFKKDVNRTINGVVRVDQEQDDVVAQELDEYVVTKEIKKCFEAFFDAYARSFDDPVDDVGVWIKGFFGSGKSHFLKILSYLLENRKVQGIETVERFREKFGDPGSFMNVDKATRGKTDAILFNIDAQGPADKGDTAILRVFAKMFYKKLGYYGENLKVVRLEQFLAQKGKTEEFSRVFEEKVGCPWVNARKKYSFYPDDIVAALRESLGMSEQAAQTAWKSVDDSGSEDISIDQLVAEINEYVDSQPEDYRLLFMIDEVGQYVGENVGLLLNLQTMVEEIGSKCRGRVWVVCTGQEAVDELIKARQDEFSRIQARFKTQLSLTSASANEVIQKRILEKTDDAKGALEKVYEAKASDMRNLLSFSNSVQDIRKGYRSATEFVESFPFVPYQFILMQKIFPEIRKHGAVGKNLSGGERSMLSAFQEAAQKLEEKDENALAPFYLFYDSVHDFLDTSIRNVIERCDNAAQRREGLEPQDLDVLKLLYLIRYVNDFKPDVENIAILTADDVRMKKIDKREEIKASLDRLVRENYVGRSGDSYRFLTDEEQDVQRDIENTPVAVSEVVGEVAKAIYGEVFTAKKISFGNNDLSFVQMTDDQTFANPPGAMLTIRFLTAANDQRKNDPVSMRDLSQGGVVLVSLADEGGSRYFELLEKALKIRKYAKKQNMPQLPETTRKIVEARQSEARDYQSEAIVALKKAIVDGVFYVEGTRSEIKESDPEKKIEGALRLAAERVYDLNGLLKSGAKTDEDLFRILRGDDEYFDGLDPNREAIAEVEKYLDRQSRQGLSTTVSDVQTAFQKNPYGWREIDVAALIARLIRDQRVAIKRGGETIQPNDSKLPDMLRRKGETVKTVISIRRPVALENVRKAREILRDFFDERNIPSDEDGLVGYIADNFGDELTNCNNLLAQCKGQGYPGRAEVAKAIQLTEEILSQKKDNSALVQRIVDREAELIETREELQDVEDFFKTRVAIFDEAVKFAQELRDDSDFFDAVPDAKRALAEIRVITTVPDGKKYEYRRIPELNPLMATVKTAHAEMLTERRKTLLEFADRCAEELRVATEGRAEVREIADEATRFFDDAKGKIATRSTLTPLYALETQLRQKEHEFLNRIEIALNPPVAPTKPDAPAPVVHTTVSRARVFPAKTLTSETEIDEYVEKVRVDLKKKLAQYGKFKLY